MRSNTEKLPRKFKIYFWDVDWDDLVGDLQRYSSFVVCRLADKGDRETVSWLLRHYNVVEIAEIVTVSRAVSQHTKSFWQNWAHHVRTGNQEEGPKGSTGLS